MEHQNSALLDFRTTNPCSTMIASFKTRVAFDYLGLSTISTWVSNPINTSKCLGTNWLYTSMVSCPKGPYPPCLRMADRAFLAGYPRHVAVLIISSPSNSRPPSPVLNGDIFLTARSSSCFLIQWYFSLRVPSESMDNNNVIACSLIECFSGSHPDQPFVRVRNGTVGVCPNGGCEGSMPGFGKFVPKKTCTKDNSHPLVLVGASAQSLTLTDRRPTFLGAHTRWNEKAACSADIIISLKLCPKKKNSLCFSLFC